MSFDEKKVKRDKDGKFTDSGSIEQLTSNVNSASAKLRTISPRNNRSGFIAQHKVFQQEFRELQKAKVAEANSLPKRGLPKGKQNKKI